MISPYAGGSSRPRSPRAYQRLNGVQKYARCDRERAIWQGHFGERAIRDDRDYVTHVGYVHINPVNTVT